MLHTLVTIVNRTQDTLQGTWNGIHVDIPPGESRCSLVEAEAYKRQNPVMGSLNPRTGKMVHKIGIVDHNDPTSFLSPEYIANFDPTEMWDRANLPGARPSEVVPGDNGLYTVRDAGGPAPFASGGQGFVKN